MRISLPTLLKIVGFFAVAAASLTNASPLSWGILSSIGLMGYLAALVVAFVGRGETQAAAIGFSVCATGVQERPPRTEFMASSHLLWAVMLGWCFATFARAVHRRSSAAAP